MAAPKPRATGSKKAPLRRKAPAKAAATAVVRFPAGLEPVPLAATLMNQQGLITVDKVAATFGMSKGQLAETIGLSREALYKLARLEAPKTQSRLKEMLEIVSRISDWAGGKEQAMAWYRAQPIAAFGGRTAEALVKDGQASALRDYLDHIALGGFA
jgi:DNA-binding XRE family transcriptional regulator